MTNLTQHPATPEQIAAGVTEPADKSAVQAALTFAALPDAADIDRRVAALLTAAVASGETSAMIGGAGYLVGPLALALAEAGIPAYHAFSARESTEQVDPATGATRKVAVFRHAGFVADQSANAAAALAVNRMDRAARSTFGGAQ